MAPSYPTALLARGLLGCGDAMTFVSVLRFAAPRFSARRYPVLVALTGTVGTFGNVLATLPLTAAAGPAGLDARLRRRGAALADRRGRRLAAARRPDRAAPAGCAPPRELRRGMGAVVRRVGTAWALPGTRLGFWVHFASCRRRPRSAVLWGHPYLVDGAGFTDSGAGTLLMVGVSRRGRLPDR